MTSQPSHTPQSTTPRTSTSQESQEHCGSSDTHISTLALARKRWAIAAVCGALLIISGFLLKPANGTDSSHHASSTAFPKSRIAALTPSPEKASRESSAAVPKPVSRKLPAAFNDLDLSDEQKDEIAAIRESRQKKLDALEEAVREYKAETEKEFESVLTNAQRKQLAQSRNADSDDTASEKMTTAKKKKAASAKADSDKPADKPAKKPVAKKSDS